MPAQPEWLRSMVEHTGRARLELARGRVREARDAKRSALRRAREVCREARASTRTWAAAARAELRERIAHMRAELAAEIEERRARVRECYGPERAKVRAEHDERIGIMRAELEELMRDRSLERVWSKPIKANAQQRARRKAEQRDEENDAVEAELSADELTVWRRVRRKIPKGTAHGSTVEHFRRWLHENTADVEHILSEQAERELREAIKHEERERRELAQLRRVVDRDQQRARDYVRDSLDHVPF